MSRAAAGAGLLAAALAFAPGLAGAAEGDFARLSASLGPTWYASAPSLHSTTGWVTGLGLELGRPVSFVLGASLSQFPSGVSYEALNIYGDGHRVRYEEGGHRTLLTGTLGAQVAVEIRGWHLAPWVEAGLGSTSVVSDGFRWIDLTTGTVYGPYGPQSEIDLMFYAGLGVRTHRERGYDWSLGLRRAGYAYPFENDATSELQVRIGIVTP